MRVAFLFAEPNIANFISASFLPPLKCRAAAAATAVAWGIWLASAPLSLHRPQNLWRKRDRSDDHEDSIASQTAVENLNLLTEQLQTIFRNELGLVRDVVEQSAGAVKHLASACERRNSRTNSQRSLENRATLVANASARFTAATSSIDTLLLIPKRKWTGP